MHADLHARSSAKSEEETGARSCGLACGCCISRCFLLISIAWLALVMAGKKRPWFSSSTVTPKRAAEPPASTSHTFPFSTSCFGRGFARDVTSPGDTICGGSGSCHGRHALIDLAADYTCGLSQRRTLRTIYSSETNRTSIACPDGGSAGGAARTTAAARATEALQPAARTKPAGPCAYQFTYSCSVTAQRSSKPYSPHGQVSGPVDHH